MKDDTMPRNYRMTARAETAAATAHRILAAAAALWREHPIDEITLQAIADGAGVSVQTVIRRFGSKDGVIAACIEHDAAGIRTERDRAPVGDVDGALAVLLGHYERDGDAVLRTLALEGRVEAAQAIVETGRRAHRAWCARVFAPYLSGSGTAAFERRLDAFVAATDLYVWKLLRRDLGRSEAETEHTFRTLLQSLTSLTGDPA